jgi:hypothetical protein
MYVIQHCSSAAPQISVSEDAGIEPRTVATLALTARRSNHLARSQLKYTRLQEYSRKSPPPPPIFPSLELAPSPTPVSLHFQPDTKKEDQVRGKE